MRDHLPTTDARTAGVLRRVLRPLARRLRGFLIGPLQQELAELRAGQEAVLRRLEQVAAGPVLDAAMARALEQALLTVALERDQK